MSKITADYSIYPQSKVISVRIDTDQDTKLEKIAKQLGTTKNKLINKAIDRYIDLLIEFGKIR